MFLNIDSNHFFYKNISEKVSDIVHNNEFNQLKNELEVLYRRLGFDKPGKQAFSDALYSFLSQEESLKLLKAFSR